MAARDYWMEHSGGVLGYWGDWGAADSVQPPGRLSLGHRHVSLRRLSEVLRPSWLQLAWFALGIWYI